MAVGAEINANACPAVLKAIMFAALYPSVLKVTTANGKTRGEASGGSIVKLRPTSVVDVTGAADQVAYYVCRTTPAKTGGVAPREYSNVEWYPLLLLAGQVTPQGSQLVLDDEFVLICSESSGLATLVFRCRAALERLLRAKIPPRPWTSWQTRWF